MPKVTIVDVARLAGVSTATVSRAMHTPHVLRAATLERVRKVMNECGYIYNATAGDFSRRKSTVIGVLVLSTTTKVAASVRAAQEVAAEREFPLLYGSSGFDAALEKKHLEQFLRRGVAGVLVAGHTNANVDMLKDLQAHGIPCVFLWDIEPSAGENYVGFDNVQGIYSIVDYCIRAGHRRIGFVCGIHTKVERIVKRYEGYKKALAANGIELDARLVRSEVSTLANGKKAMLDFLSLDAPPTCVCCASDALATGAIAAAHEKGLSVPEDISIAGFDDNDVSSFLYPPLSTVSIPAEEMGRMGMEALLDLVDESRTHPVQTILSTSLALRASVGPPKKA